MALFPHETALFTGQRPRRTLQGGDEGSCSGVQVDPSGLDTGALPEPRRWDKGRVWPTLGQKRPALAFKAPAAPYLATRPRWRILGHPGARNEPSPPLEGLSLSLSRREAPEPPAKGPHGACCTTAPLRWMSRPHKPAEKGQVGSIRRVSYPG
jgi:hypothetical protein